VGLQATLLSVIQFVRIFRIVFESSCPFIFSAQSAVVEVILRFFSVALACKFFISVVYDLSTVFCVTYFVQAELTVTS